MLVFGSRFLHPGDIVGSVDMPEEPELSPPVEST